MERLNLYSIYELAGSVRQLGLFIRNRPRDQEMAIIAHTAAPIVSELCDGKPVRLRNPDPAKKLLKLLQDLSITKLLAGIDKDDVSMKIQIGGIGSQALELETVLSNELPILQSYIIEKRGLHSVDSLINYPEDAFSEPGGDKKLFDRLKKLEGNPFQDFSEAARCLAFGFSTACGFHVMRSAEAVLRNWYMLVDEKAQYKTEWGPCVDGIRAKNKKEGNEEKKGRIASVLAMLDQIRKTRRNPLMHPEVTLEEYEAVSLFDLSKSAIYSMMKQVMAFDEANSS